MFNKIINNKPVRFCSQKIVEGCLGPMDAVDKEPDPFWSPRCRSRLVDDFCQSGNLSPKQGM